MAPALYATQAPVPPPSYHRTMATALHLDALTLVTRLQLLEVCRVAVQLAQQQCPRRCPLVPVERRESLVRPPCYCWRCCARSGGCPTKRFLTGGAPGQPWRWPAGSHLDRVAGRACPARRSSLNGCAR